MLWDLFCRVIDNHGDLGVGWRLAADLATRGHAVRLWVDDASALGWMAPGGMAGVHVGLFDAAAEVQPGDVVVELFGCDAPPAFVERIAPGRQVWINLEYLSAEPYVERSHGLPSPQPGGRTRWFFYPGFSAATGGLLREPGLAARQAAFDREAWLHGQGLERRPGEQVVVLFCYANPAIADLIEHLSGTPTLLLAAPGPATTQVQAALGAAMARGALRCIAMPHLAQCGFDELLWSADLNLVRGEDSLVRALWADAPFLWQAYPQADGVHARKLEAVLDAAEVSSPGVRHLHRWWNGLAPPPTDLGPLTGWAAALAPWRASLRARVDLTTRLLGLVAARR